MRTDPYILVADDEKAMAEVVKGVIKSSLNCRIESLSNGKQVLEKVEKEAPDLIILDWSMPVMDGREACRELRRKEKTKAIPIIMLTAKNAKTDEVAGLDAGADDYITKPFTPEVLSARVKASLRSFFSQQEKIITAGGITIDKEKRTVALKGESIELWPMEFDLLYLLMLKRGKAVSREEILEKVWGYSYMGKTRAIDATVKRLREKLGHYSSKIQTIKGIGYKFTGEH